MATNVIKIKRTQALTTLDGLVEVLSDLNEARELLAQKAMLEQAILDLSNTRVDLQATVERENEEFTTLKNEHTEEFNKLSREYAVRKAGLDDALAQASKQHAERMKELEKEQRMAEGLLSTAKTRAQNAYDEEANTIIKTINELKTELAGLESKKLSVEKATKEAERTLATIKQKVRSILDS